MAEIGVDIGFAKSILDDSGLVGIPTETVYGLAGNALNESAILRIYKTKNRPKFDPLIAHTDSLDKVKSYVDHIPDKAMQLATEFWPGPLTMLLKKASKVPDLLTSGLPSIAIRMPQHPLTINLLKSLDYPLAAPSANPFGYVSPTTAQHVADQLGDKIPYILDGGKCEIGLESTIIGFNENDEAIIYRLGGKKMEDIEQVIGKVKLRLNQSSDPVAPGMLKSHYAPSKRVIIGKISELIPKYQKRKFGVLSFSDFHKNVPKNHQIILSKSNDLDEAASQLFGALRLLDQQDIDYILTEKFPEQGLGKAINDRLKRAAAN